MLRFHCLVTARLAWTTGLTFDTDEHSGFLHWQCGNCCHVRSDNNFTSCDAAATDRISPQNFLKPDTGCVSVSFSWPGSQAVHSVSWICALAYRLRCTCAQRTIWEDFIWFILLVFKNILIYVATSLHPRNCIQGKCDVSSFRPTRCGWNLKIVGQQQVILRCWRLDSCNRDNLVFVFYKPSMFLK